MPSRVNKITYQSIGGSASLRRVCLVVVLAISALTLALQNSTAQPELIAGDTDQVRSADSTSTSHTLTGSLLPLGQENLTAPGNNNTGRSLSPWRKTGGDPFNVEFSPGSLAPSIRYLNREKIAGDYSLGDVVIDPCIDEGESFMPNLHVRVTKGSNTEPGKEYRARLSYDSSTRIIHGTREGMDHRHRWEGKFKTNSAGEPVENLADGENVEQWFVDGGGGGGLTYFIYEPTGIGDRLQQPATLYLNIYPNGEDVPIQTNVVPIDSSLLPFVTPSYDWDYEIAYYSVHTSPQGSTLAPGSANQWKRHVKVDSVGGTRLEAKPKTAQGKIATRAFAPAGVSLTPKADAPANKALLTQDLGTAAGVFKFDKMVDPVSFAYERDCDRVRGEIAEDHDWPQNESKLIVVDHDSLLVPNQIVESAQFPTSDPPEYWQYIPFQLKWTLKPEEAEIADVDFITISYTINDSTKVESETIVPLDPSAEINPDNQYYGFYGTVAASGNTIWVNGRLNLVRSLEDPIADGSVVRFTEGTASLTFWDSNSPSPQDRFKTSAAISFTAAAAASPTFSEDYFCSTPPAVPFDAPIDSVGEDSALMALVDPVRLSTGEFFLPELDLAIPGKGLDFRSFRQYNAFSKEVGPFGFGWSWSYDLQCEVSEQFASVSLGNGRSVWLRQEGGKYISDRVTYTGTVSGSEFSVKFQEGGHWLFELDTNGKGTIRKIVHENGSALYFRTTPATTPLPNGPSFFEIRVCDTLGRLIVVECQSGLSEYAPGYRINGIKAYAAPYGNNDRTNPTNTATLTPVFEQKYTYSEQYPDLLSVVKLTDRGRFNESLGQVFAIEPSAANERDVASYTYTIPDTPTPRTDASYGLLTSIKDGNGSTTLRNFYGNPPLAAFPADAEESSFVTLSFFSNADRITRTVFKQVWGNVSANLDGDTGLDANFYWYGIVDDTWICRFTDRNGGVHEVGYDETGRPSRVISYKGAFSDYQDRSSADIADDLNAWETLLEEGYPLVNHLNDGVEVVGVGGSQIDLDSVKTETLIDWTANDQKRFVLNPDGTGTLFVYDADLPNGDSPSRLVAKWTLPSDLSESESATEIRGRIIDDEESVGTIHTELSEANNPEVLSELYSYEFEEEGCSCGYLMTRLVDTDGEETLMYYDEKNNLRVILYPEVDRPASLELPTAPASYRPAQMFVYDAAGQNLIKASSIGAYFDAIPATTNRTEWQSLVTESTIYLESWEEYAYGQTSGLLEEILTPHGTEENEQGGTVAAGQRRISIRYDALGYAQSVSNPYSGNATEPAESTDWTLIDSNRRGWPLRILSPQLTVGSSVVRPEVRFEYDGNGNVVKQWNRRFEYDEELNLVLGADTAASSWDELVYTYEVLGNLTSVSVKTGPTTHRKLVAYDYDPNRRVVAVHSEYALAQASGAPPQPRSVSRFLYNSRGDVVRSCFGNWGAPEGANSTPTDYVTDYVYDVVGRLSQVRSGLVVGDNLRGAEHAWNPAAWVPPPVTPTNENQSPSRIVEYEYDRLSRVESVSGPDTTRTRIIRAPKSNRVTEVNVDDGAASNPAVYASSRFVHDAVGRTTKVTTVAKAALGSTSEEMREVTYALRPDGAPVDVRDATGLILSYQYDEAQRLKQIANADGSEVSKVLARNNWGSPLRVEGTQSGPDADDLVMIHGTDYDELGRPAAYSLNGRKVGDIRFNHRGQVSAEVDEFGIPSIVRYDERGRATQWLHNPEETAGSSTRPGPHNTEIVTEYDDATGAVTRRDPAGNGTTFRYDAHGLPRETAYANGTADVIVSRNNHGEIAFVRDPNQAKLALSHNAVGALTKRRIDEASPGSTVTCGEALNGDNMEEFSYDPLSRMIAATNKLTTVQWGHNMVGEKLMEGISFHATRPSGLPSHTASQSSHYQFDNRGLRSAHNYPSASTVGLTFAAVRNPRGQVTAVNRPATIAPLAGGTHATSFPAAASGATGFVSNCFKGSLLTGRTIGSHAADYYDYDLDGRLFLHRQYLGEIAAFSSCPPPLPVPDVEGPPVVHHYQYASTGTSGNGSSRLEWAQLPYRLPFAYSYDSLGRLSNTGPDTNFFINATDPLVSYEYFAEGSRQLLEIITNCDFSTYSESYVLKDFSGDVQSVSKSPEVEEPGCSYPLTNRAETYEYDANGARVSFTSAPDVSNPPTTSALVTTYRYDDFQRMVRVELPDGRSLRFVYDALGRLARREVHPSACSTTATSSRTYLYDGWRLIEEHEADALAPLSKSTLRTVYIYGSDGLDDVAAVLVHNGSSTDNPTWGWPCTYYAVHRDIRGSVFALTDASGAVAMRVHYDPFGTPHFLTVDGVELLGPDGKPLRVPPVAIAILWQSARWDADLGLYLMRYRWYDPELGQFLSRDPLGLWGDAKNLGHGTLFAGNDPINFVDPYGLQAGFSCGGVVYDAYGMEVSQQGFTATADGLGEAAAYPPVRGTAEVVGGIGMAAGGVAFTGAFAGPSGGTSAIVGVPTIGAGVATAGLGVSRISAWFSGTDDSGIPSTLGQGLAEANPDSPWLIAAGGLHDGVTGAVGFAGDAFSLYRRYPVKAPPCGIESGPTGGQTGVCFLPETLVATEDGPRSIAEVKVGDRVWSYLDESCGWVLAEVLETSVREYAGDLVTIDTGEGLVVATSDHPFWVEGGDELVRRPAPSHIPADETLACLSGRWVDSGSLTVGDDLKARVGDARVDAMTRTPVDGSPVLVYNLEIAGTQNYLVGSDEVLVHNRPMKANPADYGRYHGPKPKYAVNPAHEPGGPGSGHHKTRLPSDAEDVYKNAVPDRYDNPKHWYGRNKDGQLYRYSPSNDGTVHFTAIDGVGDGIKNISSYARHRLGLK